jgi:apolipoprotein N-acyltransferase
VGAGRHTLNRRAAGPGLYLPAASGALLALSLPPQPIPVLAPVALAPLAFHLCRLPPGTEGTRRAALAGAMTGGLHAVFVLHWVPLAALPLLGGALAVPAAVAVWGTAAALTAAAVALAYRASRGRTLLLPLFLGAAWVVLGWLPASLPAVGLPWLGPEAAFVGSPGLLGIASFIGGSGVAGLLAAAGSGLGVLAARPGASSAAGAAVALAVPAGAALTASSLLSAGASAVDDGPTLRVAALSVDADPRILADRERREAVLVAAVEALDRTVGPGEVELVVWPESFTGARRGGPETALALERVHRGTPILFGALGGGEGEGGRPFNRLLLAAPDGSLSVVHEKRRLVPGIEWAPPWESGGITPGPRRAPFLPEAPGASALPEREGGPSRRGEGVPRAGGAICFEALFPGEARRLRRGGARILFVASNEGWLAGRGGGVLDAARSQHLAAAVLLAAETRMPVVRSAVGGPAGAWGAGGEPLELERRAVAGAGHVILVDVPAAHPSVPLGSRGGAEGTGLAALLLLVVAGARGSGVGAASRASEREGSLTG